MAPDGHTARIRCTDGCWALSMTLALHTDTDHDAGTLLNDVGVPDHTDLVDHTDLTCNLCGSDIDVERRDGA